MCIWKCSLTIRPMSRYFHGRRAQHRDLDHPKDLDNPRDRNHPRDHHRDRDHSRDHSRDQRGRVRHSGHHNGHHSGYHNGRGHTKEQTGGFQNRSQLREPKERVRDYGPIRHSSNHQSRPIPYVSNVKPEPVKIETDGLNLLDLIDSLETPDAVEPISIMDLLNNLSSVDFDSLSTIPEAIVVKIDSLPTSNEDVFNLSTSSEDVFNISTSSEDVFNLSTSNATINENEDDNTCKGCNPPSVFSPETYPGYYSERCTCTYCPSCSPVEQDMEYDPVFPFHHGTICKCSNN